jgi:hypothetical protein
MMTDGAKRPKKLKYEIVLAGKYKVSIIDPDSHDGEKYDPK